MHCHQLKLGNERLDSWGPCSLGGRRSSERVYLIADTRGEEK